MSVNHEPAWQQIAALGGRGWEARNAGVNPRSYEGIDAWFALHPPRPGDRALELGCGGGQVAMKLAALGRVVTALDSAPTAIAIARRNATEAGFRIELHVADLLAPPALPPQDLVVDNHLLHCVVDAEERAPGAASGSPRPSCAPSWTAPGWRWSRWAAGPRIPASAT